MRLNKDKQIQIPLPDVRWLARDEESLHKLLPARETWLSIRCRNCDAVLEISGNWSGGTVNCPACGHTNPLPSRDAIGIVRRTCHNCGAWIHFFRRATDQDRSCPACGAWINKSVKIPNSAKINQPEHKDARKESNHTFTEGGSPLNQPPKSSQHNSQKNKNKKSRRIITILRARKIKNRQKQKKSPLTEIFILVLDNNRRQRLKQRREWSKFAKNIEKGVPKINGWENQDGE